MTINCPHCGAQIALRSATSLTRRQRDLLVFIDAYSRDHGICPSFDQMTAALGLHSKSGTHRIVMALEERGLISRLNYRARAITIHPDAMAEIARYQTQHQSAASNP